MSEDLRQQFKEAAHRRVWADDAMPFEIVEDEADLSLVRLANPPQQGEPDEDYKARVLKIFEQQNAVIHSLFGGEGGAEEDGPMLPAFDGEDGGEGVMLPPFAEDGE